MEEKQAAKAGEMAGGVSEIELLQRESELPIEELLSSLQEAQKKEEEEKKKSSGGKVEGETTKKREEDQPDAASLVEVVSLHAMLKPHCTTCSYLLLLYKKLCISAARWSPMILFFLC